MTTLARSTFDMWTTPSVPTHNGDRISLMAHLFNRMDGLYPTRWRAAYPSQQAIQAWEESWSEAFAEDGVDPRELKAGIANCRRLFDWPPSYREFMRACRPWSVPEVAHQIAVAGMSERSRGFVGAWPHPAIYWAAVRVGSHDLLNASYQALKIRWETALSDELAKGQWSDVPVPAPALPAPGSDVTDNVAARKKIEQISADSVNRPRKDFKAWARAILTNPKDRSPAVVAMAQRAIGEAA